MRVEATKAWDQSSFAFA